MKYAWIERHKKHWPITLQCEVLNVSASGYFEYQRRSAFGEPIKPGKHISEEALLVQTVGGPITINAPGHDYSGGVDPGPAAVERDPRKRETSVSR